MKREVSRLIIIFSLMIILIGFVSAEDNCYIDTKTKCLSNGDYIVMGLSGQTNAHGEFPDAGTYNYVLCCNFGDGDTTCNDPINPTNKIISLSSETNAHAEIPEEDTYPIDVCYDGLECVNVASCNEDYPLEILSLSDDTNAHIGEYGDYGSPGSNICCKGSECEDMECDPEIMMCSEYTTEEECNCDYDHCNVAENSEPCEEGDVCICEWDGGAGCILVIDEYQPPSCGNDFIDSELGETCDGTNFGLITGCLDLGYTGGDLSCYPTGHAKECTLDVSECEGGITGGICGDEIIQSPNDEEVYENCDCGEDEICDSEELNNKGCIDFGLSGEGLTCHLPEEPNNCTFDTTGCELGEGGHPSKIGKCSYNENTEDDCEDKFLTYSWTATWEWASENEGQPTPCEEDYVLDGGLCYYDPNGAREKCVDGSNTVPCPAQIQLPFFGKYSVVMIIGLIVLIYVFLNYKENKKSSKRKRKKK